MRTAHGPSVRATTRGRQKVTAVLFIIYLVGAIWTARRLSVPTMSHEQRPFVSAVVWPFTVTVLGLFVLLALLAHWYDRLAVVLEGQTADFRENPAAVDAQEPTKSDGRKSGGS
jgi:hypothetical protein